MLVHLEDLSYLSAEGVFEVKVEDWSWGLGSDGSLEVELVSLEDVVHVLGSPVDSGPGIIQLISDLKDRLQDKIDSLAYLGNNQSLNVFFHFIEGSEQHFFPFLKPHPTFTTTRTITGQDRRQVEIGKTYPWNINCFSGHFRLTSQLQLIKILIDFEPRQKSLLKTEFLCSVKYTNVDNNGVDQANVSCC